MPRWKSTMGNCIKHSKLFSKIWKLFSRLAIIARCFLFCFVLFWWILNNDSGLELGQMHKNQLENLLKYLFPTSELSESESPRGGQGICIFNKYRRWFWWPTRFGNHCDRQSYRLKLSHSPSGATIPTQGLIYQAANHVHSSSIIDTLSVLALFSYPHLDCPYLSLNFWGQIGKI